MTKTIHLKGLHIIESKKAFDVPVGSHCSKTCKVRGFFFFFVIISKSNDLHTIIVFWKNGTVRRRSEFPFVVLQTRRRERHLTRRQSNGIIWRIEQTHPHVENNPLNFHPIPVTRTLRVEYTTKFKKILHTIVTWSNSDAITRQDIWFNPRCNYSPCRNLNLNTRYTAVP